MMNSHSKDNLYDAIRNQILCWKCEQQMIIFTSSSISKCKVLFFSTDKENEEQKWIIIVWDAEVPSVGDFVY